MVAICTKFIGATNVRGSRIKAYTETKLFVTLYWDHALGVEENHVAAAKALANKMGWFGTWAYGGTSTGYAFVNTRNTAFKVAKKP